MESTLTSIKNHCTISQTIILVALLVSGDESHFSLVKVSCLSGVALKRRCHRGRWGTMDSISRGVMAGRGHRVVTLPATGLQDGSGALVLNKEDSKHRILSRNCSTSVFNRFEEIKEIKSQGGWYFEYHGALGPSLYSGQSLFRVLGIGLESWCHLLYHKAGDHDANYSTTGRWVPPHVVGIGQEIMVSSTLPRGTESHLT